MILGVEDLDQTRRVYGLFRDPRDIAHRVLDALAVAAKAAIGDLHQPGDRRNRDDAESREPPVQVEQIREQSEDGQRVAEQGDRCAGRRTRHLLDVVGELGQEHARLLAVEISRGQAQIVGEDIASQTLDDLPPDPARIVIADVIAEAAQREQDHDADRHDPLDPRVLVDERALQEGLDQVDQPRLRRRKQDHAEHADHEGAGIRLGVTQQPQVDRPVIAVRLGVRVDHGGDRAQGDESSCTVAMLS